MKAISKEIVDRIALEASLQRLGIAELDERLEFSPLLTAGATSGKGLPACLCKRPDNPLGGDGSTGPTGGSGW